MTIGSLFSGIGGLELGLERAGFGPVAWQVEIDPFCRGVLARHWPNAKRFDDVRTVSGANVPSVDLLCGGFPCQDVSLAGKRRGLEGERSGLWFEFRRIIEEIRPPIVIIENVLGLRTSGLPRVLADLAAFGLNAEWSDLAAADVGAPHLRRRLFIVATDPERVELRLQPGWLERACRAVAAESCDDGAGRLAADAECVRGGPIRTERDERDRDPAGRDEGTDRTFYDGPRGLASDAEGERGRALGMHADAACDGTDRERESDARTARDRRDATHTMREGSQRPIDVAEAKQRDASGSSSRGNASDAESARREGAELDCLQRSTLGVLPPELRREGIPLHGRWERTPDGAWWPPVSPIRRVDDGIPNRSHGRRLKALGNAVVPQCAELIGLALRDALAAREVTP